MARGKRQEGRWRGGGRRLGAFIDLRGIVGAGACLQFRGTVQPFSGQERGHVLWAGGGAHRFWRVILGGVFSALSVRLGNRGRRAVGGEVGGGDLCRLRAVFSAVGEFKEGCCGSAQGSQVGGRFVYGGWVIQFFARF